MGGRLARDIHLIRFFREAAVQRGETPALLAHGGGETVTWIELGRRMDLAARGLIALGHRAGDKVGICARNMPEWTQADLGILAARGVTVSLYPTSLLEQATFILRDAGIRILFAGEAAQLDLGTRLLDLGEIDHLILLDPALAAPGDPRILGFHDLLKLGGDPALDAAHQERLDGMSMDDLFTLVYTSGTTGEPKGVMLDFANLGAAMRLHDRRLTVGPDDSSLCMLPLCHIFERAWTFYVLYRGARNVYLRDPQTVVKAIGEVRPTLMCSVPRVYEKAYAGIYARMENAGRLMGGLFHWAVAAGLEVQRRRAAGQGLGLGLRLRASLAERLVFRKLRALFGGRCRFLPVAGASLADDVNLFFQAIGLKLKYGYGLSETCATVSCYEDGLPPIGTIGTPLDTLEVRLGEDNEIQVKGPTIMRGYYNRPEETARAFTADGFLRTGDAGALDGQGHLIFTERIKELMKTSNGQYVAPQRVEGTLAKDAYIEQVAIIADSRNFVSALIVPYFDRLEEHARSMGITWRSPAELLKNSRIVDFFESRLAELQKGLSKYEQVKRFTLLHRPFSMDLGELTPTLKLRRKSIEQAFRAEIEAMYAGIQGKQEHSS
ncbi:long-chain-fatty-acid--CoA ligase [Mesoterricola sediminis]|uniref:Long-chain-fatty-acid--CoA ligase n=1 Tax=Mesoterricola sediminis TaxID=2927980 RepID=A0AA48KBQ0_9BACT|nr:long-chain fatty acid--CoA ligase [Mesoterricola sediminis]BDU76086.1 long-chain-fatty-acid--CoA ligase [Mesoterricola sediminis]